MNLLILTMLIAGTLFYPYLEMQTMWYLLLFKHFIYQLQSDILLAQAQRYADKGKAYMMKDVVKSKKMLDISEAKINKVRELGNRFDKVIEQFRDRYV